MLVKSVEFFEGQFLCLGHQNQGFQCLTTLAENATFPDFPNFSFLFTTLNMILFDTEPSALMLFSPCFRSLI